MLIEALGILFLTVIYTMGDRPLEALVSSLDDVKRQIL